VTAGTYGKQHFFQTPDRLSFLQDQLLSLALQYGWRLQAWAVFSNHYHFVALSPDDPASLRSFLRHLHSVPAREMNRLDATPGRSVMYQFWETHLTFERSYFARLNYVHQNPVKHGLVLDATLYPWCSAAWFARTAPPAFYKMIASFKIDRISVVDDF
jgi:putative transposase